MERPSVDDYFGDWKAREALAQEMLPIMGKLENEKGVQIFLYGRTLNNRSVANLMKSHRRVREVARNELSEFESHPVLKSLAKLDCIAAPSLKPAFPVPATVEIRPFGETMRSACPPRSRM